MVRSWETRVLVQCWGRMISGRVLERDSENSTLDGVPSGYVKIAIENDQL